jgi:hypothetical protein
MVGPSNIRKKNGVGIIIHQHPKAQTSLLLFYNHSKSISSTSAKLTIISRILIHQHHLKHTRKEGGGVTDQNYQSSSSLVSNKLHRGFIRL